MGSEKCHSTVEVFVRQQVSELMDLIKSLKNEISDLKQNTEQNMECRRTYGSIVKAERVYEGGTS